MSFEEFEKTNDQNNNLINLSKQNQSELSL